MRRLLLLTALASPAAAAQPHASAPERVEVQLSSFDFTPERIVLRAGRPVILHLVNTSGGGHNFAAPRLFAAAAGVSGPVRNGKVEVGAHQAVDVRLTPARGRYRLTCTHTLHSTFGMRGTIVVE